MGLVVTASIWALFVATTVWFPFRRGPAGFAVFVVTLALNEIPLVLLAVFGASVVAGVGDAASESAVLTVAGLALSFAVVLGLVWLQVRTRSVAPAFERALSDGLGDGWRSWPGARAEDRGADPSAYPWGGILLPFQRHDVTVERVRGVPYAPGARPHRLDVYRRKSAATGTDRPSGRPVLIHFHGGGFVQGGKSRESVTMLNQLADHGWVCLSADYGLRSDGKFPRSLVDVKRVIRWTRVNADELGADPDQIFLAGASAGGHLAVSAALTACDPRFQPGFEDADTRVAAAVALYGYLGGRGPDPASSPARLARADAPPVMIVHGGADTAVRPEGPRSVAAALAAVSASPVVYAELPHTQHGFDFFASVRARVAADAVEGFMDWVRSHRPTG